MLLNVDFCQDKLFSVGSPFFVIKSFDVCFGNSQESPSQSG